MAGEQEQLVASIESALQTRYGDTSLASMRKLFDSYDTNKDGKIDKDELIKLLKDVGIGNSLTRGKWAKGIIDKLDTDADKAISWDEFQLVASTKA